MEERRDSVEKRNRSVSGVLDRAGRLELPFARRFCGLPEKAGTGLSLGEARRDQGGGGNRLRPASGLSDLAGHRLGAPPPDLSPGEALSSSLLRAAQYRRQWRAGGVSAGDGRGKVDGERV